MSNSPWGIDPLGGHCITTYYASYDLVFREWTGLVMGTKFANQTNLIYI